MTRARCLQPPTGPAAVAAARHRAATPRIETARLVLRAPTLEDFDLWRAVSAELEGASDQSPESAWADYCVYVAGWSLHGHGLWTIERDGAAIGFVLIGLEWGDEEPELGYLLHEDARGRGFATEAAAAARDHARSLFGDGGFVSYVDPGNTASARLAARLGGRRDALAEARLGDAVQVWRHGAPRDAEARL